VIEHLLEGHEAGRLACVHVQHLTTTKATHGVIG
jgi:hypothetical protein